MNAVIQILNGTTMYEPAVLDGINWSTERKGSPGKLTFTTVWDENLNIQEGNPVRLIVDDVNVFFGFVFKKNRANDNQIKVTAYDQLRYFKNKDTYQYEGWTASHLLEVICNDYNLKIGTIEDTGYVIPKRLDEDKTLFDIEQAALEATLLSTNKVFVLFDDFGTICLKNVASMKIPLLIDSETAQTYDYTSSIDENTYNQIKLTFDNTATGQRDIYMTKDSDNINKWGVLQYYEKLDEGVDAKGKAETLLSYYNKKTRRLRVSGCFGDVRARAGASPLISLDLGDVKVANFMVIAKASHTFKNGLHTMDLDLEGGEFIG